MGDAVLSRLGRFGRSLWEGPSQARAAAADNDADLARAQSAYRQIARQAPYMRRYARALTGAQPDGDGLVQRAIDLIQAGSVSLAPELPPRAAVYQVLHSIWRESLKASLADGVETPDGLEPESRAALLLSTIEGFNQAEAALVLSISEAELSERLRSAHRALDSLPLTEVLIIEDEPIIALDLTRLVRDMGHIVAGAAATRSEAVRLAEEIRPGLLLADIRLADGTSGMDAAVEIRRQHNVPVIFITAFPEYLLTGERPEPAFLITKPFREDAVKALVGQALFFHTLMQPEQVATS